MQLLFEYQNPNKISAIDKIIIESPEIHNDKDTIFHVKATAIFIKLDKKHEACERDMNFLKLHFENIDEKQDDDSIIIKIPAVVPEDVCNALLKNNLIVSDFIDKLKAHKSDDIQAGHSEDMGWSW